MKTDVVRTVRDFDDDYEARREKNYKKKAPKHGKMGPMKKPKYKDRY